MNNQKILILIALFVSLVSLAQIDYDDLMQMNSLDMFKKACIENDLQYSNQSNSYETLYNEKEDSDYFFIWAFYESDRFFILYNPAKSQEYHAILNELKAKCSYSKIQSYLGNDFVLYSCGESKYKGKIGVTMLRVSITFVNFLSIDATFNLDFELNSNIEYYIFSIRTQLDCSLQLNQCI